MLITSQRKVIERLLILHQELSVMRYSAKGVYHKKIYIDPDLLIYDVFRAIFGRRKGKKLCKQYLNGID